MVETMSDASPNPIRGKLRWQRAALWAEAFWNAAQRPLLAVLLALAALWSGVLVNLPRPLPLVALALVGLGIIYTCRDLLGLARVSDLAALRKLDTRNGLAHREASSLDDTITPESGNAEIWEEHLRRKLAALKNLKLAWPQSAWRNFDPMALRVPVAMAAVSAFLLGPGDLISNFRNAASIAAPAKLPTLDAWLKPPAYTGKQPLLLTAPAMVEKLKEQSEITVPENSVLNLRLQGAAKPQLLFISPGANDTPVKLSNAKIETDDSGLTADVTLDRPVTVKVMDGDKELATYPISLVSDEAPKIEFAEDPKTGDQGKLQVKWHASDDYGIKSVTAEISLADEQQDGTGFEGNGVFLYDPPEFKIALKKPGAKDDTETTLADLTSHPWAGLFVEMVLTVTDGAGHKTTTAPKRFKLPERDFIKPLAQALVEQRKNIILSPDAAPDASTMLDAMLLYPVDIADESGLILNLAAMKNRLASASAPEDVVAVVKDIWPLIVAVDSGKLDDARAELKALAQQLRQALRDGAPQEKIDELTRRMKQAMDKLMSQLQKQGKQQQAQGMKSPGGRNVTPKDLQQMLDDIDKLNQQGNKDAAEQMLSQLDEMLQNLKPGDGQQADGADGGLKDQMDALSGLMGKQKKLMDETQRLGKDGQSGDGQGLGDRQKSLKDQLGKMGQGLNGEEGGDSLGEAGKNMGKAEGSLRGQDKQEALRQQNQALRKMMEGMGKLAQQLNKQGQGRQGSNGTQGKGNEDPLGRPRATHDPGVGPDKNLVPSELAMRRAREILEELRSRANEQGLDDESKAYIDRLLKDQF